MVLFLFNNSNDGYNGNYRPHGIDKREGIGLLVDAVDDQKDGSGQIQELKGEGIRFYSLRTVQAIGSNNFDRADPAQNINKKIHW
jgi:hypothetical protein